MRIGGKILVAACVATTVEPTTHLLKKVAEDHGGSADLSVLLMPDAWALFEAGQKEAYQRAVAEELQAVADGFSVIVLAQASMAGAAQHCRGVAPKVLSSPVSGVKKALERLSK